MTGAMVAAGSDRLMDTYPPAPVTFVRGQGCWLYDTDGREYLDLVSGLAVVGLGHCHPAVAEAIAQQARQLCHVSNLYGNLVGPAVAAHLDRLVGGGSRPAEGRVFLANSGAEANECAIKLARRWAGPGRHVVLSALGSFHGRTLATLHATGQPAKHGPFQPLPEGFRHVPWGDLDGLEAQLARSDVAGLLLEVIQGEGGVIEPPPGWLEGARQLCDRYRRLLMIDEVQTGLGRTGSWFAFQAHGITPDVVTVAKALGNGMPIGACWARADVAAAFGPGDHATTFGGQPLASAAALATLEAMEAADVCANARSRGRQLARGLATLEGVTATRGRGLMLAAELDPSVGGSAEVADRARQAGVLVNAVGPGTLRLLPPLVISSQEVSEAVDRLGQALGDRGRS